MMSEERAEAEPHSLRRNVPATDQGSRWFLRGRWRLGALSMVFLAVGGLLAAATARLFVWPARGVPAHVDAIIVFGGRGDRLDEALSLAYSRVAPNLVISRQSRDATNNCSPFVADVTIICFNPDPVTTQGEAEFAGRLAATNHWHSLVLVTTRPQDTRARLRMSRCFDGQIFVATAHLRKREWPRAIAYEWGALLKALLVQRSC